MQGRNGDADVENELVNMVGKGERERESGMNGESSINIWIAGEKLPYNTGSPAWCSVMTYRGGMREGKGGSREKSCMYN